MQVTDLVFNSISFKEPERKSGLETPAGFCKVVEFLHNDEPLVLNLRGVSVGNVQKYFENYSMYIEISPEAIDTITKLESMYTKNNPVVADSYKLKTCLIENDLLRIKLPLSPTGRRFAGEISNKKFTPSSTDAMKPDTAIEVGLSLKFWLMDGRCGLFTKLVSLKEL